VLHALQDSGMNMANSQVNRAILSIDDPRDCLDYAINDFQHESLVSTYKFTWFQ
jgi:phage shock protein A